MARLRTASIAVVLLGALTLGLARFGSDDSGPAATLAPIDVVRIQVDALQHNDDPAPDAGIRTAFRFASPGNRETTGPIDQFIRLVRSGGYHPLINHREARYGKAQVTRGSAIVPVVIVAADGTRHGYIWVLSQQEAGQCTGCWMTDSVVPHPVPGARVNEPPPGRLI